MPFSPEHFITPATDPVEWERQAQTTKARMYGNVADRRREQEQSRQFEIEQDRLRDQAEDTRRLGEARLSHDVQTEERKHAVDVAKFRLDEQRRLDDVRKNKQEGMKLIREAFVQGELPEEFDGAAFKLGQAYRIMVVPGGTVPPGVARQVAQQAGAAPTEPGMAPPPGFVPSRPGEAPAPAGAAPAQALPPGQAPAPAGAAPAPAGAPGQAPAPAGAAPTEALPPGQAPAPGATPTGAAPDVTTGATAVATAAGETLGVTTGKPPMIPKDAKTAEEAVVVDKENPVVEAEQKQPPKTLAEVQKQLADMKPVTHVESLDRLATDAQLARSYQKRVEAIDKMGLSPTARAILVNYAAQAHDMPPVPVPDPPAPPPDQPAPAGALGPGEWEVTLPPGSKEFAAAPPELLPSVVRDMRTAGSVDYYDMDTGEYWGSDDWSSIQEGRIEKRRKEIAPIMQGLGTTPLEQSRINSAAESYILSGDKKYLDILQSVLRVTATSEARGQAQTRADQTQFLNVTKEMQSQADNIVADAHKNEKLTEMKKTIADTNNTLSVLRNNPGAIQERKVMTDLLKAAHNGRATDKDAAMSFRAGLWTDVENAWKHIDDGGKLSPGFMKQLEDVIKDINRGERKKQIIVAESLAAQVYENYYMQSVAPQASAFQARGILRRAFPEMSKELIDELVADAAKNAPPLGAAAVNYGTPKSTSSSSSVREDVRVTGPKTEGGTPKPKRKKGPLDINKIRGMGDAPAPKGK